MKKKWNRRRLIRLSLASVCTLAVALLVASWNKKTHAQNHIPAPMTTDWSNRHMVYSAPSSMMHAWRLQAEPRYLHQLTRRNVLPMQAAQ
jgi:negative regulator of sigma E activity